MQGLSNHQVAELRARHGWNRIPQPQPPSLMRVLLRQFAHAMSLVLLGAGAVSWLVGAHDEAMLIGLVLVINGGLGSYQEIRAEKGARALQQLLRIKARVIRESVQQEVDADELVPGDIVLLESGDCVPADLRLEWSQGLELNESFLTGESLPVTKDACLQGDLIKAFAASTVVRGRGRGLVESTGSNTAVGTLAQMVTRTQGGNSPLQIRLQRFAHLVAMTTGVLVLGVAALGYVVHGYSLRETFFFSVALAVSAIPEGLPIAVTVALSISATRLARKGVIVRRLEAVEGLGSCTLIASDKTGTLTMNQLMVSRLESPTGLRFEVEGAGLEPQGAIIRRGEEPPPTWFESVARVVLLCNESGLRKVQDRWVGTGDPLEVSLLALGAKLGFNREDLLEQLNTVHSIPFEAERKYSASFHRDGEELWIGAKGAPEALLPMCSKVDPEPWTRQASAMAAEGLRVLLLTQARVHQAHFDARNFELEGLTPLALVGMADPLRPEVLGAVRACQKAGIRVVMITGDHPATALTIARQLDMADSQEQVAEGHLLVPPYPSVEQVRVFARIAPDQKLGIVQAAQREGHFVAVTGDGVNDAPALRAANIGVAMGRSGTDVAREAADLVITDDNFATLVAGIEEGRIAYNNLRKVIFLLISTGLAEVITVLCCFVGGLPMPFLPSQLLWLNLVTNGIQDVALAFEPGEGNELESPPRSASQRIFDALMLERVLVSVLVMAGAGLAVFTQALAQGETVESCRNLLLLLFVLLEIVQIGNCRSETKSAFSSSPLENPLLMFSSLVALFIHLAATQHPVGHRFLGTQAVSLEAVGQLAVVATILLLVGEAQKFGFKFRQPGPGSKASALGISGGGRPHHSPSRNRGPSPGP